MVWLTRIFIFIFIVVAFALALAFMTANESSVAANFLLWEIEARVGVLMVSAFAAGLMITLIATYPVIAAYKFHLRRAQKKQLELSASNSVVAQSN